MAFVNELSQTKGVASALDCVAHWLPQILPAERASICLDSDDQHHLQVFVFSGNEAIPLKAPLPITSTMVGRVFRKMELEVATNLSEMTDQDCQLLAAGGLTTCMDAPLQKGNTCFGTINIAHSQSNIYTAQHEALLQCIANWVAGHIFSHRQLSIQKKLAATDPLTEISNRRYIFSMGQRLMELWLSQQTPFILIMMDLDNFKMVNDQYGHDTGDFVLIEFGRRIGSLLRESDGFARVGGEEFLIILENENITDAQALAERLLRSISDRKIQHNEHQLNITMSVGITQVDSDDTIFDHVFSKSDRALYQSKSNGRNQITLYSPSNI